MEKVKLTDELSRVIRNLRNDKGIKAFELAKKLNKSLAYISKLEHANLKFIEFDTLIIIFKFLNDNEEDFNDFINKTLKKAFINFTLNELEEQQWIIKLDEEIRQILIPKEFIDYIKNLLAELNIVSKDIVNSDLNDLIAYKMKITNYITLKNIVKNILEFKYESVTDEELDKILKLYDIRNLYFKKKELRNTDYTNKINTLLNTIDETNINNISKIVSYLNTLYDWQPEYTANKLNELVKNFEIDSSFILAILGTNFYDLKQLKKDEKSNFLEELSQLINKYKGIKNSKSVEFIKY